MKLRGIVLGTVLALVAWHPAAAKPSTPSETVTWDVTDVWTAYGTPVEMTGAFTLAPTETAAATVVVERQVGATWRAVTSRTTGRTFAATVPAEAATYRAVLTVAGRSTSALATVTVVAAESRLTLSVPKSARDRTAVKLTVGWTSSTPPTGKVVIDFRRRGTDKWIPFTQVNVVNGVGSSAPVLRDDGEFRARFDGDERYSEAESAVATYDNVPIKKLALRLGQFNVPGADKLKYASTRARAAAAQIRSADLDVVLLNELVGPGRNSTSNRPSSFAESVRASLGSKWRLITPTTAYNENYVAYRTDRLSVITQFPDRIIPGTSRKGSGRHLTPVLFKDLRSNQPVLLAGTHLVENDHAGARKQAATVAAETKARSFGYPVVVAGDMNTPDRLTALTNAGLKDARRSAKSTSKSSWSTYTRYSLRKPWKKSSWIIDQIYVPSSWTVSKWTTVVQTKKGRFLTPRPSDHSLVWITATSKS